MHNPPRKIFILLLFISLLFGYFQIYSDQQPLTTFLMRLETTEEERFYGYVEGEFLYLAMPVAGTLTRLLVQRGNFVNQGDRLLILESEPEATGVREAEHRLEVAQTRLKDLKKGQRPSELDAITARRHQVDVDLELAQTEQARHEALFLKKMLQQEVVDAARAATKKHKARREEIEAQLHTAQLMAREDVIEGAKAEVAAAQSALEKSRWWLAKKQLISPTRGQIVDTFYHEGEWVPTGNPVISLLPPEQVKILFFVPETQLGKFLLGHQVCLECDGCDRRVLATIDYISPEAEYTPPVIYSQENRAKLVYMIEAQPKNSKTLHPGQPVEVKWLGDQLCSGDH